MAGHEDGAVCGLSNPRKMKNGFQYIVPVCVRADKHVCSPNYEKFTRTHSEHATYMYTLKLT